MSLNEERKKFGIAFDIDGVILRGGQALPHAISVLSQVKKYNIPHIFMTNNGMETESDRAIRLSKTLDLEIEAKAMIMCHSALKYEAEIIRDELVLVTGYTYKDTNELMRSLGFKNVHTTHEYTSCYPELFPVKKYPKIKDRSWADERVAAVIIVEVPMDWQQDIQLISQLSINNGYLFSKANKSYNSFKPKIISCNFDFTFPGVNDSILYGPGAFVEALKLLYSKVTNDENLDVIAHGKPYYPIYKVTEERLKEMESNVKRIYAIGDNPKSDIRGANGAGDNWISILVQTGCHTRSQNDELDPADYFFKDVLEAFEFILKKENILIS